MGPETGAGPELRAAGETVPVVLAAGLGTRMNSRLAKALHELGGQPLVEHVLRAVQEAGLGRPVVVVGYQKERLAELLEERALLVEQPAMHGTGDAVMQAVERLGPAVTDVLVLYADCPLIPADLLRRVVTRHRESGADVTLLTTLMPDPRGYGRILRDAAGRVRGIVEEREATPEERAVHEVNTGIGVWRVERLRRVLPHLPWHGEERYLTEALGAILAEGGQVEVVEAEDPGLVMGINTRRELAQAEARLRELTLERLLAAGVTVVDPATTYVDPTVEVGQDTIIYPLTFLRGRTRIGRECRIGPMTTIVDSRLADGVTVQQSVVESSVLGTKSRVGPFSHLRPGTRLDRDVAIGNFVELKNTQVGIGSKAGHHSYLGDATIGSRVNIGAGTVIVNFDGKEKHRTFIGDQAFIGCNSNLVSPVEIGAGAYVAAGSTITQNVPADALGIARARQENKPGWSARRR
ncbi:bifunctional glucosamine-1-phosphate N-acetyltransferase/UDP-N-acetylglucosamine pyrophosphorylase [Candidatus Hydrogenisulfobacillus filiaventi]|uniref:Bifunctional protein GlmU n=1 Tax=Candidatus Hydrogenisulfobacillus filiaventi TaxID=2707344 RepID=A0A6F8ZJZ6_9FIRM|nr:bifunctional UDP-N-acetylglucosamine diphosphorylase/glucosamine-1-phosphate N-acetyltransferase GlmU [Bacillota bacterium]CAB1130118.1 bifunctional glucosamine-1-phosphate N-acetyltransferase/UDP-N-acetylglucosamine pyrophosphorylase [Candidatus Hydrogenisulfobacillus filiaventi]